MEIELLRNPHELVRIARTSLTTNGDGLVNFQGIYWACLSPVVGIVGDCWSDLRTKCQPKLRFKSMMWHAFNSTLNTLIRSIFFAVEYTFDYRCYVASSACRREKPVLEYRHCELKYFPNLDGLETAVCNSISWLTSDRSLPRYVLKIRTLHKEAFGGIIMYYSYVNVELEWPTAQSQI